MLFWILLGWICCVLTALTIGFALFHLLRVRLHWMESVCLGYVAGSAVLSLSVFTLAAVGIASKGVFLFLSVISLAALVYFRRTLLPRGRTAGAPLPLGWKILFIAGLLAYGIFYFRQALSPEMSPDALEYHLGLINQFYRARGLVRFEDMYAALPQGVEMLFFFAFAIGRNSAAALVHFSFLVDLALLMALYGRRFGFATAGAVAALLVFASPLVGADGTCAFNDVGLATVVFAAVYLLSLWRDEKSAGLLIACCIVTGFALAVKYTAVYVVLFVVVTIAVGLRGQALRKLLPALAAGTIALGVGIAPYLVRNALWFHNPVAFFGNSIFRNPYFHISFEQRYIRDQAHWHGLEWKDMLLQLSVGGPNVEGCFGAVFFAAPLILAGVFWPRSRFLMLAALAAGFAFPSDRSARFLIPALPFLAMGMMFVLRRLPWPSVLLCGFAVAHLLTSWPFQGHFYPHPGWRLTPIPWRVALRKTPEYVWLMQQSESFAITHAIDAVVPADEPIFTLGTQLAKSYSHRKVLVSYQSAFGEKLADLPYTTWNSPTYAWMRWHFTFPPLNARDIRLVQSGSSADNQWSVNEVQLESGGVARGIGAGGHPYAWPNPWDASMAFDGITVTRWRTWEPMRPGMRLGARFDSPVPLSGVVVLFCPDEWDTRLRLQILDDRGKWIEEAPPALESIPPVDLRKQATQELRRQGFRYVLISRLYWSGREFIDSAREWGFSPVAQTPNYVLFEAE